MPAQSPVSCSHGDIFCRECALSNILSQKKEIKRLEKTREKEEKDAEEDRNREEEEAKQRAVQEFERIQMGLEAKMRASTGKQIVGREDGKIVVEEDVVGGKRGEKRKFELDEDELLRIALDERTKARKAIDEEKVYIPYTLYCEQLITPPTGIQDDLTLLLGTVYHPIIKHQCDVAYNCEEDQAITRVSCVTSRYTSQLFPPHPNHGRVQRGEGRVYRHKSASLSIVQESVEQYLKGHACKAMWSCSLQELRHKVRDANRSP
jgi:hypothetical protein